MTGSTTLESMGAEGRVDAFWAVIFLIFKLSQNSKRVKCSIECTGYHKYVILHDNIKYKPINGCES